MATKKIQVDDGKGNTFELIEHDGLVFPVYFCDDIVKQLQGVKDMPGRDDDVLIVAFPKAGTHWLWEITNMLLRQSADYHPDMKEAQMIEMANPAGADQLTSPRVFNTHLHFRQLPKDMKNRKCKMIYITRNPKDMAVSRYCHNTSGKVAFKGTFSDYLALYLQGKAAFGSWFDYTEDWSKALADDKEYPIHMMVYEELKRDTFSQVKKLAEFLGTNTDDSFIQAVCDKCDFKNLKTQYADSKNVHGKDKGLKNYIFRKGEIGDWKNWFTVAESEHFDKLIEERLPGHNDTFTYQ